MVHQVAVDRAQPVEAYGSPLAARADQHQERRQHAQIENQGAGPRLLLTGSGLHQPVDETSAEY